VTSRAQRFPTRPTVSLKGHTPPVLDGLTGSAVLSFMGADLADAVSDEQLRTLVMSDPH